MKTFTRIALLATLMASACVRAYAQDVVIEPYGSYLFAQRDTCELFMDVYNPAFGSERSIDGIRKPTIVFMFGGGFMSGSKSEKSYLPWYKKLTSDGFRVIAIDYRLGLNGVKKMGVAQAKLLQDAIHIAVEDLYSATAFILDNADELGVEPDNIVIAGSSAGAISVLQADWELCNRTQLAQVLPENFHYAGVMSFSGAVFSNESTPKYKTEPAPTMMLHGTADKLVPYKKIKFLNLMFAGTGTLAPIFLDNDYNVNVLRFKDSGHEISTSLIANYQEEMRFIETNVMKKEKRVVDATIDDPTISVPEWSRMSADELYN